MTPDTPLSRPAHTRPALARVDGCPITTATLDSAITETMAKARRGEAFAVFTLNLDHLVKLRRNPDFKVAYDGADIVTADGWPVAWMARWQNPKIERTTGADLVSPLVDAAAANDIPIFLFGTSSDVMARVGRDFSQRTDGALDIAGTLAPSAQFDPTGPEADDAIERIRASGARLCFIALGAPKQELFAAYARSKGLACGMLCIGAGLDFIAGTQVRAPEFFRHYGMEWAWRLALNPRRLARRYGECAMVLADLAVVTPMRERLHRVRG